MKKLMVIMFIVAMALFVSHSVYAVGTTAGTFITNKVKASGANFTAVSNANGIRTNVQVIVGGGWSAQADVIPTIAGTSYSNVTWLTNLGNANYGFLVTVTVATATGGAGGLAGFWPWTVTTNGAVYFSGTGNATAGAAYYVPTASSKKLVLKVAVPGAMASSGYEEYTLSATVPTAHVNTIGYNGDNGTIYGGSTTTGWGRAVANQLNVSGTAGAADITWRLTGGGAPSITISKIISGIAIADAAGVDNVAVPGATITYVVKVSNAIGAGIANNVIVRDDFDLVNMTLGTFVVTSNQLWRENGWGLRNIAGTLTFSNTTAGGSLEAGNCGVFTITGIIR